MSAEYLGIPTNPFTRRKRKKPLAAKSSKNKGFKAVKKTLSKKIALGKAKAAAKTIPEPEELQTTADDIRRNDSGRKHIRKVVADALNHDQIKFHGETELFHAKTGACCLKGLPKTYVLKTFLQVVPKYFEYRFPNTRKSEDYGRRVFDELQNVVQSLKNGDRRKLILLIKDVYAAFQSDAEVL